MLMQFNFESTRRSKRLCANIFSSLFSLAPVLLPYFVEKVCKWKCNFQNELTLAACIRVYALLKLKIRRKGRKELLNGLVVDIQYTWKFQQRRRRRWRLTFCCTPWHIQKLLYTRWLAVVVATAAELLQI